jgi:hypothetical protein
MNHPHPAVPRPSPAAFVLLLVAVSLAACSDSDRPSGLLDLSEYWSPMGLAGGDYTVLELSGDDLYVASRHGGVERQSPAFIGRWTNLGLAFTDLESEEPPRGLTALAVSGGEILAGVDLPPRDTRSSLYRLRPGGAGWDAVSGVEGPVAGLIAGAGGWHAVGDGRVHQSPAVDGPWAADPDPQVRIGRGSFAKGQDGTLFLGGRDLDSGAPLLLLRRPGAPLWERLFLVSRLGVREGVTYSAARTADTPGPLFITVNADVFRSDDEGQNFELILPLPRTPGRIFLHPDRAEVMLIPGGVLHYSGDGGRGWFSFEGPAGFAVGDAVPDWTGGRVAAVINDGITQALFVFDLRGALEEVGAP